MFYVLTEKKTKPSSVTIWYGSYVIVGPPQEQIKHCSREEKFGEGDPNFANLEMFEINKSEKSRPI